MELNILDKNVISSEVIYDSFTEQPIECDVILPDYCPEILKILTCTAEPSFTLVQALGEQLGIDGHTDIKITYLSEDGSLHTSEHRVRFSKTIDLKSKAENAVVYCTSDTGYINCRAVNSRRVDIRGAFTINISVISQKQEKAVLNADGAGIQLLKEKNKISEIVGNVCRCSTVREETSLENGSDKIKEIIKCSCSASVTDYKAISNKIITKGEIKVNILYVGENNEKDLNTFSFTIPISQIIDMEGVDENCRCDVKFKVVSCEINEHDDNFDNTSEISVEATFCADVKAYRDVETEFISDCYSTLYDCGFDVKNISLMQNIGEFNEVYNQHNDIKIPDNIVTVRDVSCTSRFIKVNYNENGAVLNGKLTVFITAQNQDNEIVILDETVEFNCKDIDSISSQEVYADILMNVCGLKWRVDGNVLKLDTDILIKGNVICIVKKNVINKISIDEEKGEKPQSKSAITIYFADEGENVWEIAKKYNTSVSAVIEENSLEDKTIEKRSMLLIPMIR